MSFDSQNLSQRRIRHQPAHPLLQILSVFAEIRGFPALKFQSQAVPLPAVSGETASPFQKCLKILSFQLIQGFPADPLPGHRGKAPLFQQTVRLLKQLLLLRFPGLLPFTDPQGSG